MNSSKESVSSSVSILSAALNVPAQAEDCLTLISARAQVRIDKPQCPLALFIKQDISL